MPGWPWRSGRTRLASILAPSPRRVEPETVKTILEALKGDGGLRSSRPTPSFGSVGVFVNETPDAMRDIMIFAGLDSAQIHGDETPEACAGFDFPLVQGFADNRRRRGGPPRRRQWRCPRLLVDSAARGTGGGTGVTIGTWAALAAGALAPRGQRIFVAGGVRPRRTSRASYIRSRRTDSTFQAASRRRRAGNRRKARGLVPRDRPRRGGQRLGGGHACGEMSGTTAVSAAATYRRS